MSAARAVQNAIATLLAADATLAALSLTPDVTTVEVFNDVPPNQNYPHVLISRVTELPNHVLGGASVGIGWSDIVRIHVYSRYQGDKEALQIYERIVALLNFQALSVSGFTKVTCACESMRVLVEDIEKVETRHLVGEFKVKVRP